MSESGDRPAGSGQDDPTQGAFDAARDPWARPPEEPRADETVKLSKDAPAGGAGTPAQPSGGPPAAEPPSYEPPTYIPSGYDPPAYQQPSYEQPSYQQPAYEQPAYQQPSYQQPPYSPPASEQPAYPDPNSAGGYGQPYSAPAYGAADPYQQYGQQGYSQPYGYGAPGYPAAPYPGPAYGYGGPTNSGKATAVMILGICSIVFMWCYGVGVVPAIVALAMSGSAKREIETSGGRLGGLGMVTAGRVTSWIAVGLTVLFVVIIVLVIAFAPDSSSTYNGN